MLNLQCIICCEFDIVVRIYVSNLIRCACAAALLLRISGHIYFEWDVACQKPAGHFENPRDARNAWKIAYYKLWSSSEDSHLVRNYILLKYGFENAYEIQKQNCNPAMQSLYWTYADFCGTIVCCVWWISCFPYMLFNQTFGILLYKIVEHLCRTHGERFYGK